MDRLVADIETEEKIETTTAPVTETKKEEVVVPKIKIRLKQEVSQKESEPAKEQNFAEETPVSSRNAYISSFGDLTVADIKKQEEDKRVEEFNAKKDELLKKQFEIADKREEKEEKQEVSQNVIEKPNYDLIEENRKVIKLKQSDKKKKTNSKKVAGIVMACTLGASALVCVTNTIIIDNMSSNFTRIDETYKMNLKKYLKHIYDLDTTKKSMEMIETYPEDTLDAGDLGKVSNWFDRLCNFIGGMFGG